MVYNPLFFCSLGAVHDNRTDKDEMLGPPAAKVRRISADGYRWVVNEVAAPPFDRRGGTHLVFDGETIMRRVRFFPPNWFELSDDDLYALSRRLSPPAE